MDCSRIALRREWRREHGEQRCPLCESSVRTNPPSALVRSAAPELFLHSTRFINIIPKHQSMSFQFIGMERPASEVTHEERLAILSAVATAISELKTGKSSTDSQAFSHGATSISEGPETSEESETESSVALPAKVEPAAVRQLGYIFFSR